jgi:hypothetical protein
MPSLPENLLIAGLATGIGGVLILLVALRMKKSKGKGSILVVGILSAIAGAILLALRFTKYAPTSGTPPPPAGGDLPPKFVPGITIPPGSVTITGATGEKSSPQVNISFSYDGLCSACNILFDLTITYNDGTTYATQGLANPTDGFVIVDYTPGFRPLPPGPVQLSIIANSNNPQTGENGPQSAPFTVTVA